MKGWNEQTRDELRAFIDAVWIPEPTGESAAFDLCESAECAAALAVEEKAVPGEPPERSAAPMLFGAARPARRMRREAPPMRASTAMPGKELARELEQLDEGFSRTLLRLIDAKGMTDAACYRRAGVDRRLFSKIRSDPDYRPSKPTAAAFAFALGLSPDEARTLLEKAGFALSRASKFDVIVEFFLTRGIHDLDTVNQALFEFDQPLLGAH